MTAKLKSPVKTAAPEPLLAEGMRLDAEEFHRRYELMPNLHKAELIEGVVHMPSPSNELHGWGHISLAGWSFLYIAQTPGVLAGDNASNRLNSKNEYQPDVQIYLPADGLNPSVGKRKGILLKPPTLAIEVSVSSKKRDRGKKFGVYEASGVSEYLIWSVEEKAIEWFRLIDGKYETLTADADGIHQSVALPGLWLDAPAMIDGNYNRIISVLNMGIASPDHAAFVESLKSKPPE